MTAITCTMTRHKLASNRPAIFRSLNGCRATEKRAVSTMTFAVRSISSRPGRGDARGKSSRSITNSVPSAASRVTGGRSARRISVSLTDASSRAYGDDNAHHRTKPARNPAATLARLGQRFFGKLPAPQNENRNRGQNYEGLPDRDVEEIENAAIVLSQPEKRAETDEIQKLDGDARHGYADQPRAQRRRKREDGRGQEDNRLHSITTVPDIQRELRGPHDRSRRPHPALENAQQSRRSTRNDFSERH